ncbi:MAG: hypothetical protein J5710_09705 [Treponema sp.]|nr:hypothetical protein [Treponema sp.]
MINQNINTYNESSLHNTLKLFYAAQYDGQTEVKADGHIYDILCEDGLVIEIQTGSVARIADKLKDALNKGHKVILVYPLVNRKRIFLTNENGEKISNRLSPKKGCIYDILEQLTKITDILLNPNFTLEIITIDLIEHRIRTTEAVQTKNRRRRYKKNWLKANKRLEQIIETTQFKTARDYLALLPKDLPQEFCAKDLNLPEYSHLLLWVLSRIPVIEQTSKKGRTFYYKIKPELI